MALFSHIKQATWIDEVRKWGWHWRKDIEDYHFGRYTSDDKESFRKITLSNGKYCEIIPKELKKANNSGLKRSQYVSLQEVLLNSTPLQIKKI